MVFVHLLAHSRKGQKQYFVKDTLQTEASDVRLDEVQVFVSVVVLLLQCADGVTLRSERCVMQKKYCYETMTFLSIMTLTAHRGPSTLRF